MSLRILLDEIKDPNNIVGLVNAFLVSYVVMTTVYNLYLHPLAKYPGPFWCKLSSIPSWYYTKNQDRHLWLLSLQEKYGGLALIPIYTSPHSSFPLPSHVSILLTLNLVFHYQH